MGNIAKYPFAPKLLDALPEELAELFRGLELKLLEEICSRLKISGQLNEVTVQDIRALRSHGIDLEEIKKAIARATDTGLDKLNTLLDDVVERNQAYYTSMLNLAQVTAPERMLSHEDLWSLYEQTRGDYRNITRSMGFQVRQGRRRVVLDPARAYQWALDQAALQVQSGAVSYNQAISEAVRELADSGLKTVSYDSGHVDSVDVAVRRAVMTGVNQLNQRYREQSMDYLETDLVEVTAHLGARNIDGPNGWENHAKWQGKVYRWRRDGGGVYEAGGPDGDFENQAKSGTIGETMPKDVPDMSGAVVEKRALEPEDVTQEYLDAATPGQGSVTYEDGYKIKNHQAEIDMANWLHRLFGGNIQLLKEAKNDSIKRPDYLWNKVLWELKSAHSINAADKRLQDAIKQIQDDPGGVILNVVEDIDMAALERQLTRRFYRDESEIHALDLMILSRGELVKILRYKK